MGGATAIRRIEIIDTHTGGEPTRVVVGGGPDLGLGDMASRRKLFREQFDDIRSAIVNEPRGSDVMVGALICEPTDPSCAAGVIFFNNIGYLGMCGHGTIGVAAALAHAGRIEPGRHRFETPVGEVSVELEADLHHSTIENVASYRTSKDLEIDVPGLRRYQGDVAWGGNWFFLVYEHREDLALENVDRLTEVAWQIRRALAAAGIRGDGGEEIDHIELYGPPTVAGADSRNFVLCPGKAYDRSPCGTGTSAKLACLFADGKLAVGAVWRQESIVGSVFEGTVRVVGHQVIPRIRGAAYVNAESTILIDPTDPFAKGIAR